MQLDEKYMTFQRGTAGIFYFYCWTFQKQPPDIPFKLNPSFETQGQPVIYFEHSQSAQIKAGCRKNKFRRYFENDC